MSVTPVRRGAWLTALDGLDRHCRSRLAPYKVPKSYEFVTALPRDEAGKIRRSALAAAREAGWTPAMRKPMRAIRVAQPV